MVLSPWQYHSTHSSACPRSALTRVFGRTDYETLGVFSTGWWVTMDFHCSCCMNLTSTEVSHVQTHLQGKWRGKCHRHIPTTCGIFQVWWDFPGLQQENLRLEAWRTEWFSWTNGILQNMLKPWIREYLRMLEVSVNLTQSKTYLGRTNLNSEITSIKLGCRHFS